MAIKLSEQALKNKRAYDKKYARENFQGKYLTFNKNVPEEMEMFEWVRTRPEGGNPYLKRLIREDMERQKANKDV